MNDYTDDLKDEVVRFDESEVFFGVPETLPADLDGKQDDEGEPDSPVGFLSRTTSKINTWLETLDWYRDHQTTSQIGFNPDGMCLKVCRTARKIPARYLTAKEAQDATPEEHRVYNVRDLRKGMVLYFDDPNDSNRAGHIVTQIGRVRGFNPHSLNDIIVETNSVKSGELVRVRASYFSQYWGDSFKFGATMLNGVELDVPKPKAKKKSRVERFNNGGPVYDLNLLNKAAKAGRPKAGEILRRLEDQIRRLPDNQNMNNVREFKDEWRESRVIDMKHLNEAVNNGRVGLVKKVRDEIRRLISELPDE